jgi:hypothetical protein
MLQLHLNIITFKLEDIYILNDTAGRIQNQLNVLGEFCSKYGLSVNLSKSNVVVFRSSGPLKTW